MPHHKPSGKKVLMVKKINLILATLYSIILAIVEAMLNWGDWQYAPLWIVDYLIVIILLLAVFVFKKNLQRLMLLLGWTFSSGVMYMGLFLGLDPDTILIGFDKNILFSIALALIVSVIGIILTIIDNKNN
jgi:hypothetical protein